MAVWRPRQGARPPAALKCYLWFKRVTLSHEIIQANRIKGFQKEQDERVSEGFDVRRSSNNVLEAHKSHM